MASFCLIEYMLTFVSTVKKNWVRLKQELPLYPISRQIQLYVRIQYFAKLIQNPKLPGTSETPDLKKMYTWEKV